MEPVIATELNPALTPVSFLLGTWRGEGEGQYPSIKPFRYREEIRFTHNGKPFLVYSQRTEAIETGSYSADALALYRGAGFTPVDCWGEYATSPTSICLEKKL